jgi:pilus assembly protein Flp/PilA
MLSLYLKYQDLKYGLRGSVADKLRKLRDDESGATAIEYGLIAAGIAVAIVAVVFTIGDDLVDLFTGISDDLQDAGDR